VLQGENTLAIKLRIRRVGSSFACVLFAQGCTVLSGDLCHRGDPTCSPLGIVAFQADALTGAGSSSGGVVQPMNVLAGTQSGLAVSTDGGITYTNKTTGDGLSGNNIQEISRDSGILYIATDFGITIDNNGSLTIRDNSDGMASASTWDVSAVGSDLYVANNSSLAVSTDGGASFVNRLGGTVVYNVLVDGLNVYAGQNGVGFSYSTDGAGSFLTSTTAQGLGNNTVQGGTAKVGTTLFVGTNGGLSVSTDNGASFTNRTTANGLGSNAVRAVYYANEVLYVGTTGGLSMSTDGGNTFTNKTTAAGLGNNIVQDIMVVGQYVYAGTSGGISISTDGGETFTNYGLAAGLANVITQAVYVH